MGKQDVEVDELDGDGIGEGGGVGGGEMNEKKNLKFRRCFLTKFLKYK